MKTWILHHSWKYGDAYQIVMADEEPDENIARQCFPEFDPDDEEYINVAEIKNPLQRILDALMRYPSSSRRAWSVQDKELDMWERWLVEHWGYESNLSSYIARLAKELRRLICDSLIR